MCHHVVLTVNRSSGANASLYSDGSEVDFKSGGQINLDQSVIRIGRTDESIYNFNGLIDEVKIWDGVLSDEEACEEALGNWDGFNCEFTGIGCIDNDNDGFNISNSVCGGNGCGVEDCDDTNENINPGEEEICDNQIDDDCDGLIDENDPDCFVHDVGLVDFTNLINKIALYYLNGSEILGDPAKLMCNERIKAKVKVKNEGNFNENVSLEGELDGIIPSFSNIDGATFPPGDTSFRTSLSPYINLTLASGFYDITVEAIIPIDNNSSNNKTSRQIEILCPEPECEENSDCDDTECNNLDGCVGNDYYDYYDTSNNCVDFECEENTCNDFNISYNDERCGQIIIIIEPDDNVCPEIYQDHTQRSWEPNDQTFHTAVEYGEEDTNCYGDSSFEIGSRGNYVFEGETLTYYVIVEDENGDDEIENVNLEGFGGCLEINPDEKFQCYGEWGDYAVDKFGIDSWNPDTMNLYKCKLIVQDNYGLDEIIIKTSDGNETCGDNGIVREKKEDIFFNPELSVSFDGVINFGIQKPGSIATSNSIKIENNGEGGVIMDMYIASDDYFTDPGNENAICGDGNGIKYDRFSYYATKGSLNSGKNDNQFPGLGKTSAYCSANPDEFTKMPSHSGHIEDMCRIINHKETGSFLSANDFMSITFKLDIPEICKGSFNDGQFHLVGRVV